MCWTDDFEVVDVAVVGETELIIPAFAEMIHHIDASLDYARLTPEQIINNAVDFKKLKLVLLTLQGDAHSPTEIEFIKEIVDSHPQAYLVCVAMGCSPMMMYQALKNGAVAFIPGTFPLSDIQQIIEETLDGKTQNFEENYQRYIDDYIDERQKTVGRKTVNNTSFTEAIFKDIKKLDVILNKMTPRQTDIFQLLGEGYSNKQIARQLAISDNTVRNHLAKLLKLFLCTNRTQLGILSRMLQQP